MIGKKTWTLISRDLFGRFCFQPSTNLNTNWNAGEFLDTFSPGKQMGEPREKFRSQRVLLRSPYGFANSNIIWSRVETSQANGIQRNGKGSWNISLTDTDVLLLSYFLFSGFHWLLPLNIKQANRGNDGHIFINTRNSDLCYFLRKTIEPYGVRTSSSLNIWALPALAKILWLVFVCLNDWAKVLLRRLLITH